MSIPQIAATALALTLCASCASPTPATVHTWGTLREALRDGQTKARVRIDQLDQRHLFAVGAATDLDGEITVLDGTCYTSRVRAGAIETQSSPEVAATILFGAHVPAWQSIRVDQDVPFAELAAFVVGRATTLGIDTEKPFPFVVEGDLLELDMHVLQGECPVRARILGKPMQTPPVHRRFDRVAGTLVGIHATHGGGVITHHGSALHVHAIVREPESEAKQAFTGHCDRVGISAGAVVRLPDVSR